jgi:hypothetical protein
MNHESNPNSSELAIVLIRPHHRQRSYTSSGWCRRRLFNGFIAHGDALVRDAFAAVKRGNGAENAGVKVAQHPEAGAGGSSSVGSANALPKSIADMFYSFANFRI